jgi:prophage tail gpP-like protein
MPEIKATPTKGYLYTIQSGDTMTKIGLRAGMPWQQIWAANPSIIRISNNPDLIYPNQTIFIPGDTPSAATTNPAAGASPDSYKFLLAGHDVKVATLRLQRSLDSIFDSWTAEIAWKAGADADLDKATAPYGFQDAMLYLGQYLVATGRLYDVSPKISDSGSSKILECFTATVDLVDSKLPPNYSMEWAGATIGHIAADILNKLGFRYHLNYDPKAIYPYAIMEKLESPARLLIKLARERSILVTNDEYGAVVLMQPNPSDASVGTIEEPDILAGSKAQGSLEWSAKFAGRERFHNYIVIGQGGDATDVVDSITDNNVPGMRSMTYESDYLDTQNTSGDSAAWRRSTEIAKAMNIPIPLAGWYCPDGRPWSPGMMVTVKSGALGVPSGYKFCIRKTEHVLDERGMTCILNVCPPNALTGQLVDEPWTKTGGSGGKT